jgi:LysR family hydrogen peroxide-inducible transcriptional activator
VAIADTGNFTRASAKCNVSQPSLSQQIINLEKELGHKLFHRLGRKAVLTEAGTVFIERARRILFEVEDATKELSDSPSLERRIVVGAIPTLAPYVLPKLITHCRSRFPNLQIIIHEDFKQVLIHDVLAGELDLALVAAPVVNPMIQLEPLWKEPLILAVPKGHRLASKAHVTGADLIQETFILMGSSSSLTDRVKQFCGDYHFEPRIGSRCAQVATVKALVAIGAGISILPNGAKSEDDHGALVYISLADAEPFREIVVLRHMQRYQSRGAEQFLSVLREEGTESTK